MRGVALSTILALAGMAAAAQAAEGQFIHPADTNKDQRIDKAEWVAAKLPEAQFAGADANKDGKIDGPEFVKWHASQQAGGHEGHAGHEGH
jgi:hypothetical protein